MNRSKFLLFLMIGLILVVGSYAAGRMRPFEHHHNGVAYTQAMLAFAHYNSYGYIANYLARKCYDAALAETKELRDMQVVLLADNLQRTGNDPSLQAYIRVRDPELLKSVLAGHVPELPTPAQPLNLTCP